LLSSLKALWPVLLGLLALLVALAWRLNRRKGPMLKQTAVGDDNDDQGHGLTRDQRHAVAAKLADLSHRPVADVEAAGRMVVELYNAVLNLFAEWGWPRSLEQTPDEFARTIGLKSPRLRTSLDCMTQIFCQVFYGRHLPDPECYQRFLAAVAAMTHGSVKQR